MNRLAQQRPRLRCHGWRGRFFPWKHVLVPLDLLFFIVQLLSRLVRELRADLLDFLERDRTCTSTAIRLPGVLTSGSATAMKVHGSLSSRLQQSTVGPFGVLLSHFGTDIFRDVVSMAAANLIGQSACVRSDVDGGVQPSCRTRRQSCRPLGPQLASGRLTDRVGAQNAVHGGQQIQINASP